MPCALARKEKARAEQIRLVGVTGGYTYEGINKNLASVADSLRCRNANRPAQLDYTNTQNCIFTAISSQVKLPPTSAAALQRIIYG